MKELHNKKVFVKDKGEEIVSKLKELGFKNDDEAKDLPFIFINADDKTFEFSNLPSHFYKYSKDYEEVDVDYILNLKYNKLSNEPFIEGYKVRQKGKIYFDDYTDDEDEWFRVFNDEEEAIAWKHLPELLYWRDKYNEGWKPNWEDGKEIKYKLFKHKDEIDFDCSEYFNRILAFKTREIRDKFMEDFEELIEKCKPLL